MSRGLNKVALIGNLGARPDSHHTTSGNLIVNLRLATNESWTDKATGERKERTEWHRLVLFGKLAEVAQNYLDKGSQVFVEGRIQSRKWSGDDDCEHYANEIVVNEMIMLDGKSEAIRPASELVASEPF